eukprot:Rhum_TRINITY_DN21595_c0_g1::Rhum_TRINITY_DN21595_c0_g1_i1::g.174180::m.174180
MAQSEEDLLRESCRKLECCSLDQLDAILKHDAAYELILHEDDAVPRVEEAPDGTVAWEEACEADCASTRAELAALQADTQRVQAELRAKLQRLQASQLRRAATMARLTERSVVERMQAAAEEKEGASEETLAAFLAGHLPTSTFIANYTRERRQLYTHREKMDRGGKELAAQLVSAVKS